jgi:hypothetical protein
MFRKRLYIPRQAAARNWGDDLTGHYILVGKRDHRALKNDLSQHDHNEKNGKASPDISYASIQEAYLPIPYASEQGI